MIISILEEILSPERSAPPNEAATRSWVIDPLLKAIGYSSEEILPNAVESCGTIPDYTLLPNHERFRFPLEAKDWNRELTFEHVLQTLKYAESSNSRWAVLTNGKCWHLFDNSIQAPPTDKLVAKVSIEDQESFLNFLSAISRDSIVEDRIILFAIDENKKRKNALIEKRSIAQSEQRARVSPIPTVIENVKAALFQAIGIEPCDAEQIPVECLGRALQLARALSEWSTSVEAIARQSAESGTKIPGVYLKTKEGNRSLPDTLKAFEHSRLPVKLFLECCKVDVKKLEDKMGEQFISDPLKAFEFSKLPEIEFIGCCSTSITKLEKCIGKKDFEVRLKEVIERGSSSISIHLE